MMTKNELESTSLFKTLKILESKGFQPEGFRYRKDIVYTEPTTHTHAIEKKSFPLYIDILVNAYPPSLYDIYPNSFFEVPLLEQVYSQQRYQVRLVSVSNIMFIPIREIIIAMKIQSLLARGTARHKKVKDLCDLYGLLWYSSRSVEELIKTTQKFVQRGSVEQLKKTIDSSLVNECEVLLGEPKGSVNTVLHALYDLRI